MIIVSKHIAIDPDSGLKAAAPHLEDGTYANLCIRRVEPTPIGRKPFRDDLCNPEPHSVRGFNTLGNY